MQGLADEGGPDLTQLKEHPFTEIAILTDGIAPDSRLLPNPAMNIALLVCRGVLGGILDKTACWWWAGWHLSFSAPHLKPRQKLRRSWLELKLPPCAAL